MFEKIINIWGDMVDLNLIPVITRNTVLRNMYNNDELQKISHDLEERVHNYRELRQNTATSQARLSIWMNSLYSKLQAAYTPATRTVVDQVYG